MTYRRLLRLVCVLHCQFCGVYRLRIRPSRAFGACYGHDDRCLHMSVDLLADALRRLEMRVSGEVPW